MINQSNKIKRYTSLRTVLLITMLLFSCSSVIDVVAESMKEKTTFSLKQEPICLVQKIPMFKTKEERDAYFFDQLENKKFNKILDNHRVVAYYGVPDSDYSCGYHLGVDYKAESGKPIYAPTNSYVLFANGSYSNYGFIGNTTSVGLISGGNQIHLITEVDNKVYGVIFLHLKDVNVESGDIVKMGDTIGTVGQSGSATGPHLHVELYELGEGNLSEYINNKYDYSFNVPRYLTNRRNYPQRVNPANVWK